MSRRQVARELGFSEGALRQRLKFDCGVKKLGRFEKVFNTTQEIELVQHAVNLEKLFYGLTFKSLRKLAYEYATVNNINNTYVSNRKSDGRKRLGIQFYEKAQSIITNSIKNKCCASNGI